MLERFKKSFYSRSILKNLVIKQIKSRYAGLYLGFLWSVILPLILALVISFVFTQIIRVNIRHFPFFIISGFLPWFCFSNSLNDSTFSLSGQANILRQFRIPADFLPISMVCLHFVNLLLALFAVSPFFIFSGCTRIPWLLFLVLPLSLHFLFTAGLGLVCCCLYIRFKDFSQALGIILLFWLWLTPIFYTSEMLPSNFQFLLRVNPVYIFIELYRAVLFQGFAIKFSKILLALGLALGSLFFGFWFFFQQERYILKRI